MEFSEDARYHTIAQAYALDAVDFARDNMKRTLDWTDQSIHALESILDVFSRDLTKANPPDEHVIGFSRMWGSYLGEVYRKNHGAIWGLVTHGDQSFPGLRAASGTLFWPWGRVENRIRNGPEDKVWHYYLNLTGQLQASARSSSASDIEPWRNELLPVCSHCALFAVELACTPKPVSGHRHASSPPRLVSKFKLVRWLSARTTETPFQLPLVGGSGNLWHRLYAGDDRGEPYYGSNDRRAEAANTVFGRNLQASQATRSIV